MIVLSLCRHIKVTSPLIYHQELALILSLISENNQFRRKKKTALSTLRTRVPPITYSHTAHCLISLSDWIPPPQPNFFAKGTGGTTDHTLCILQLTITCVPSILQDGYFLSNLQVI